MPRLAAGLIAACAFLGAGPTGGAASTPVCAVTTTTPAPRRDRPSYVLRIDVEPGLMRVDGTSTVSFAPGVATDRIVFRLWPNSPFYARRGARLTVDRLRAAGRPLAASRPDPTTLVVRRALAARKRVTISMRWTLRLPRAAGLQLHGGNSLRLVSFFPLLAWNGSGWATEAPVRLDSFWPTSPTSDFDVHLTAPAGQTVLASGEEGSRGHWRARAVRDFAAAVGSFRLVRSTIRAPRPVRLTVGLERGSAYDPRAFLASAATALRFYAQRYGNYPWSTYSLAAMNDFDGLSGTAYPTIGFLSDRSLVLVPHETAHQWFASLVGNDQSRDPWLSEGLATWAQAGLEQSLAAMLGTTVPSPLRNRIGEPMQFWQSYDFEAMRRGLYVQSAQALASLGSSARVDCALRRFVVRNAYGTATPDDLLTALVPSFPRAEQTLRARGARF